MLINKSCLLMNFTSNYDHEFSVVLLLVLLKNCSQILNIGTQELWSF